MTRFVVGLALLRRDPGGLRYLAPFARSLLPGHSPLSDVVPMMPFRAVEWLRAYLQPRMRIFEYGSGGSTVFFASRAEQVVSVEHDAEWYARTEERLRALDLTNCTYVLEPAGQGASVRFTSTDERYRGMNFENYVKTIAAYPDGHFDLAAVDGRARVACVLEAIPKVRNGGFLLLDDAYRDEYAEAMDALAQQSRVDYSGIAPSNTDLGLTSVWKITS
jgi:precorrin-6B methylase 2